MNTNPNHFARTRDYDVPDFTGPIVDAPVQNQPILHRICGTPTHRTKRNLLCQLQLNERSRENRVCKTI
jgi:hypothetical protein